MPIRRALPTDAAAVAAVHVRSWQAAYRDLIPAPYLDGLDVTERTEAWRARLTAPDGPVVLVAEDASGRVEAFSCFRPWPPGEGDGDGSLDPLVTAELAALYAAPEAWGRGVGRALLVATVDAMGAAGFRGAGLWVFEDNARARGFYEEAAWRPDGVSVTEETGGRLLRELRYRIGLFM
ncbi:GNAT family N-acetyltransferase [Streptomyces sp. NPDC048623]|uniref:GNAT family N-acetyltransferase n=1 Tax=Streptomyces sp. NPDC048623 TaxID=3155761 RepID=UPI00343FD4EC